MWAASILQEAEYGARNAFLLNKSASNNRRFQILMCYRKPHLDSCSTLKQSAASIQWESCYSAFFRRTKRVPCPVSLLGMCSGSCWTGRRSAGLHVRQRSRSPSGESAWGSVFKWATASRLRSTASATLTHQAWLISRSHLQSIKHTCKCTHTHAHACARTQRQRNHRNQLLSPLSCHLSPVGQKQICLGVNIYINHA